jgi:plasmid stabilization system protein ParE
MTGYAFHPEARFDLDEIWEFLRAENLDAADRIIAQILAAIDALERFPHQGHRRPDLTSRPLRFKVVREYLIAYAPDRKAIVGCGRNARTPQSSPHGRYPEGQRVTRVSKTTGFGTARSVQGPSLRGPKAGPDL